MAKLVINSYEEFASHLGEKLGESDWLQIDQDRINKFADATLDPQWIHVDVERAKVESPYHSTIAHGYLTLIYQVPGGMLSNLLSTPIPLAADYRSKQPQDARKLRHGQDEVRSASHHRFTRASGSHSPRHPEHPWHLQDQHQV